MKTFFYFTLMYLSLNVALFGVDNSLLLNEIHVVHDKNQEVKNIDVLLNEILFNECYTPYSDETINDESFAYKNEDYGIDFESGGKYTQGDSKQNNRFLYAGLAWDVFSEGYFDNDNKAKIIKLKHKLKMLNAQSFTPAKYEKIQAYIQASFNNKKLDIYTKKTHLNALYKELIRKKYFFNLASKMDVEASRLTMQKDLFLEQEYIDFKNRLQCNGSEDRSAWPYFKIDMFDLKHDLYSQLLGSSSECLNNEIIDKKFDWKNKVKLKLYARGENTDNGSGASLGFNLRVPLTQDEEKISRVQRLQYNADKLEEFEYIQTLLDRQYYDLKQKTAKAIKLQHTHKKLLRKLELHRASFNIYDKLNTSSFIKDLEELYALKLEILENKQQIYQKGFQILFLARQESVKTFSKLHFKEERVGIDKIRVGIRSMYIWANDFNSIDNETIFNILQAKEVEEALVSMSKRVNEKKLEDFFELAKKYTIKVTPVYSNNRAIYTKNYASLKTAIKKVKKWGVDIQLDIEPHALAELKKQRSSYYQMYANMLEYAYAESNQSVKIDIAIPLHYDERYVEVKYAPLIKNIYLMAYEHSSPEYVIKKIQKFSAVNDKLIIAVSPSDFKNEWEMENFIEEIMKKSKVTRFAIHDLKKYKELLR